MKDNIYLYRALTTVGGLTIFASLFYFAGSLIYESDGDYSADLFSTGWNMLSRGLVMIVLSSFCEKAETELAAIRKMMFSDRNKDH